MPRNPGAASDIVAVIGRHREEIRQLRNRGKGHTEERTFVAGGDISTGLDIMELYVGIDFDDHTPEWKKLVAFRGHVRSGSVTVDWYLNGVAVLTGHVLTGTPPNVSTLDTPIDLADGDIIRPVITAGTATGLSASVVMVTGAL